MTYERTNRPCRCGLDLYRWRPRRDDLRDSFRSRLARLPVPKPEPRWHQEPPTERQLGYLTILLDGPPPAGLTRGEACDLIGKLANTPRRRTQKADKHHLH